MEIDPEREQSHQTILSSAKQALRDSLETHPALTALSETRCSEEVYRAAAHVVLDTELDAMLEHQRSEFLKSSAGKFGYTGYISFIPED